MPIHRFSDTPAAGVDATPPRRPALSEFAGKVLLVRSAAKQRSRTTGNEYWVLVFQCKGQPGVLSANTSAYGVSKQLDAQPQDAYPFVALLVYDGPALRFTDAPEGQEQAEQTEEESAVPGAPEPTPLRKTGGSGRAV